MLTIRDLPNDENGWPKGLYQLRIGTLTDDFPNAHFRNGVAERVPGRDVARIHEGFGASLMIAPGDQATAELCARHVFERTGDGAKSKVLRALFAVPKTVPAKAAASVEGESESEASDGNRHRRRGARSGA